MQDRLHIGYPWAEIVACHWITQPNVCRSSISKDGFQTHACLMWGRKQERSHTVYKTKVIASAITAYMKTFNSGWRKRFLRNHSSTSSPEFKLPKIHTHTHTISVKHINLKDTITSVFVTVPKSRGPSRYHHVKTERNRHK